MKYIYGLDLSMSCSGYCIMDINGNIVKSGEIKPKSSMTHGEKLKRQYDGFLELIELYSPYLVGIEKGFTKFNKSTQVIFRAHGVANLAFCDYEQVYFQNNIVKLKFAGSGGASKEKIIAEVKKRYGLDVKNDEADAIAVAYTTLKSII